MLQMLGSLMNSRNYLKITQDEFGQYKYFRYSYSNTTGDRTKTKDNVYDSTSEISKAFFSTSCNGKTMKLESDLLMMYYIINDLSYTGMGDKSSKRNKFSQ